MPDISQVVAIIEQSNLVADEVIAELRQRLEKSRQPVDLKTAVKWLVQKEHITSEQGRRLLTRSGAPTPGAKPAPADDDDLKLFEEPPAAPPPSKAPAAKSAGKAPAARPAPPAGGDDDLELFPLNDVAQAA
ncbi:MAG: hypothetical protein ACREHD_18125, partial [Pirellulales bacterium]